MNLENTTKFDRRSVLKAVGVGGVSLGVVSGETLAQTTGLVKETAEKSVKLVQTNLESEISIADDQLTPVEAHADRFTQYSIQDDTLIVSGERADERLSFGEYVVSPQNLGSKTFESASGSVSPMAGSDYLISEVTESLSPTKVVQTKTPQSFGNVSISRTGDDVIGAEFQGSEVTVKPKSSGTIRASEREVLVEVENESTGKITFEPASVTPTLHVKNHGELDYYSQV